MFMESDFVHLTFTFDGSQSRAKREAWEMQRIRNARTVITAAKSGNLRYLYFWSQDEVFAIRTLLPGWVGIVQWDSTNGSNFGPWMKAAVTLRAALSHIARWHNDARSNGDRLTPAQVQAMPAILLEHGGGAALYELLFPRGPMDPHPLQPYFSWLETDAVSQSVAEAWSAVVDRREENTMGCFCERCKPDIPRRAYVEPQAEEEEGEEV